MYHSPLAIRYLPSANYAILSRMSQSKMPPIAHKLYAIGLVLIVVFVLIAWAMTAFSVSAKTISNLPDHNLNMPPSECVTCHQTKPNAPKMPHVEFPSCGYCHR